MTDINIECIKTRDDFITFLSQLIGDFNENKNWSNNTLSDYLEAMKSWIEDMDGFFFKYEYKTTDSYQLEIFRYGFISSQDL